MTRPLPWKCAAAVVALVTALGIGYGVVRPAVLLRFAAPDRVFDFRGDAFWKFLYLQRSLQTGGDSHTFQKNAVHPVRGWTPLPNLVTSDGNERTNSLGMRSPVAYVDDPSRYTVLIVGDSFTYGAEAPDEAVWPTILQGLDTRLNVANLAVGGYGLGQMYLTVVEHVEAIAPDLVILAAISDDLNRSLLSFREYWKPRLVLDETGALGITNTPVPELDTGAARLWDAYGLFTAYDRLRAEDAAFRERVASGAFQKEWEGLNRGIVVAASALCHANDAALMVVHLASGVEVSESQDSAMPFPAEELLRGASADCDAHYLATRPHFASADQAWPPRHYQQPEAELVARAVLERIQALPSYTQRMRERERGAASSR